jgi:VCBS repeat-containing protein
VTITATGAHDNLVVSPVVATLADTPFPDDGVAGAFGNLIAESTSGADASNSVSVTEVNGDSANVGLPIAGPHGTLFVSSDGTYSYIANATVDPLQEGDSATDHFTFTVMDSFGATTTTSLDFHVVGANDNPRITGGTAFGTITEDAGPSATVNGGFENGNLTGWFATSGVSAEFLGIGGQFGNYDANLGGGSGSLEQDVSTTAGQHYTLSFYVGGDPDATSTSFTAFWDGAQILSLTGVPLGFTHYTFDVVGDALDPTTQFFVDYSSDGTGLHFDELSVNPVPGPATESTSGSVSFSDAETADTHTTSFAAGGSGYVGTFSLDPVSESGSGSLAWHFSANNADIQFLAQDQSVSQIYTVFVTDNHGGSTAQQVTVTINGTNDAPSRRRFAAVRSGCL